MSETKGDKQDIKLVSQDVFQQKERNTHQSRSTGSTGVRYECFQTSKWTM